MMTSSRLSREVGPRHERAAGSNRNPRNREGIVAIAYRDHSVLLSEYILAEVREHYISRFKATDQQADLVVHTFRTQSEIVMPAPVSKDAFSDADDLPILGTAVAAHADYLVTGDKRLQELKEHEGIGIISLRELYDLLCTSG